MVFRWRSFVSASCKHRLCQTFFTTKTLKGLGMLLTKLLKMRANKYVITKRNSLADCRMVFEKRNQSMAWMETDYSKHTHFRWKIKWWLVCLSTLRFMGETAHLLGMANTRGNSCNSLSRVMSANGPSNTTGLVNPAVEGTHIWANTKRKRRKTEPWTKRSRLFAIFKQIPVSSVGKFRTGRIVYHLQKIPIMENVFHFFTQSASVAPGREN